MSKLSDAAWTALALYRSILKVHRTKLPPAMRGLGDKYVRDEFSAHLAPGKASDQQWATFLAEWARYREMLAGTADLVPSPSTTQPLDDNNINNEKATTPAPPRPSRDISLHDENILVTGVDKAGNLREDVVKELTPEQRARLGALQAEAARYGRAQFGDTVTKNE